MKKKIKLIIDTDNGTDIDDVITLYYALKSDVEIVGIISSYLNSQLRTLQVKHVLKLFGREDIPAFAGCGIPLEGLHGCDLNYVYNQYTPELGKQTSKDYSGEDAIDFLISKAKEFKDELYILEIAPETTLAKAILKDKDAFKDSHIFIMAGHFYESSFEWNVECDGKAAQIIVESGLNLTYVGLDVSNPTEIKDQKMKDLFFNKNEDPKLDYLVKCVNAWQKTESRGIILYDPITFLTIIDDSLCEFETKNLVYNKKDNHAYLLIDDKGKPARIAKSINMNKFNEHVFRLFEKE